MRDVFVRIFQMQLVQMVDSTVPTTREFWRKTYCNASDDEARDPRPFADVIASRSDISHQQAKEAV